MKTKKTELAAPDQLVANSMTSNPLALTENEQAIMRGFDVRIRQLEGQLTEARFWTTQALIKMIGDRKLEGTYRVSGDLRQLVKQE